SKTLLVTLVCQTLVGSDARLTKKRGVEMTAELHVLAAGASEDYRAACERAAVFDLSARGRIEVIGAEAPLFLHNLCTNDIKNLAVDAGCEMFLCNPKARVLAHGWVYRLPGETPSLWLDVAEDLGLAVYQHLNRHWI